MTREIELAAGLLEKAKKKGATSADLIMAESDAFSVQVRLGEGREGNPCAGETAGAAGFFWQEIRDHLKLGCFSGFFRQAFG
jgi:hypothetical protein